MDTRRQKDIYNAAKSAYGRQPQASILMIAIALQAGKATYAFPINQTSGALSRTDSVLLNQNDLFVASHVQLGIKSEDVAKPGSGVIQTYPNKVVFVDETDVFKADDLEAVFNSLLTIKVGDKVEAQGMDMRPSRVVRTSQQSSGANKSENLSYDGMIPLEPVITFDGSNRNDITLNISSWPGQLIQSASATKTVYAVLKFNGFLVTGIR